LAHTLPGRDADVLARIRLIADTVRNAPGMITARFYRGREHNSYYFMLTTWEDESLWQKAQERYNPKHLLLASASELLSAPPEQWWMQYLWGYSRPAASPTLAAAHIATIRSDQVELAQRGWIEGLRRQVVQPVLTFAFLARGANEDILLPYIASNNNAVDSILSQQGTLFLNLLSWPGERERDAFYTDRAYHALGHLLNNIGALQVLSLDPL
jgi:quinol monooxygenase YgiN